RCHAEQLDLRLRIRRELLVDPADAGIEQFACRDLAAWLVLRDARVTGLEHADQEIPGRGGTRGFALRALCLPCRCRNAGNENGNERSDRCHWPAITAHEAAEPVQSGAAACEDRLNTQVAIKIPGELMHRCIAPRRLAAEAFGDDGVEVAAEAASGNAAIGVCERGFAREERGR